MPSQRYTRVEVRNLLDVSEEFLFMLEREDIVRADPEGYYEHVSVERVRICWNLHHDMGVNLAGQEVVLHLLERLEQERAQFQEVLRWLQKSLGQQ
jgi:hypothetical protein